jgi:hypothetical protein
MHPIQRFTGLAALSVATLSLLASRPAAATVVTIGTTSYDVFVVSTSQQASAVDFAAPGDGGQMPWWKDAALAALFAQEVFDDLGPGSNPFYGPIFAYDFDPMSGNVSGVYQLLGDLAVQDMVDPSPAANDTLKYAIATAPVPLPLPLFGAAAGFSWSWRLRRRVRATNHPGSTRLP